MQGNKCWEQALEPNHSKLSNYSRNRTNRKEKSEVVSKKKLIDSDYLF